MYEAGHGRSRQHGGYDLCDFSPLRDATEALAMLLEVRGLGASECPGAEKPVRRG